MRVWNRDRFTLETPWDPLMVLGSLRASTAARQSGSGQEAELLFTGDLP